MNSKINMEPDKSIVEPSDTENDSTQEFFTCDSDISSANVDTTAYFSFDSSSSGFDIQEDIKTPSPPKPKKNLMFTEYREKPSFISDTSSSTLPLEESILNESSLVDRVVDTSIQEALEEVEHFMSNLRLSSNITLRDEKERSFDIVNKMLRNSGDEFGPNEDTTNLLMLASQSLETYGEIEKDIFNENMAKFDKFPVLTDLKRPFKTQKEKQMYLLRTTFAALYTHATKANKVISLKRGYASV